MKWLKQALKQNKWTVPIIIICLSLLAAFALYWEPDLFYDFLWMGE